MDFGEERRAQFAGQSLLLRRVRAGLELIDHGGQVSMPALSRFQALPDKHQHGPARAGVDRASNALDLGGDIRRQRHAHACGFVLRPFASSTHSMLHGFSMTHAQPNGCARTQDLSFVSNKIMRECRFHNEATQECR